MSNKKPSTNDKKIQQLRSKIAAERRRLVRQLSGVAQDIRQTNKVIHRWNKKSAIFLVATVTIGYIILRNNRSVSSSTLISKTCWSLLLCWLLESETKQDSIISSSASSSSPTSESQS